MTDTNYNHALSAYGGEGWQPRERSLREELGTLWAGCGIISEWGRLRAVLLHRPGDELAASVDFNAVNFVLRLLKGC